MAAAQCMSLESSYGWSQFVLQRFVLACWNSFSVAWGETTTYTAYWLAAHQKWRPDPHWATLSQTLHSALIKAPVFSNNLLLAPGTRCCESLQRAKQREGRLDSNMHGVHWRLASKCHSKWNMWGVFTETIFNRIQITIEICLKRNGVLHARGLIWNTLHCGSI